jgi:hypothetical protein
MGFLSDTGGAGPKNEAEAIAFEEMIASRSVRVRRSVDPYD